MNKIKEFIKLHKAATIVAGIIVVCLVAGGVSFGVHQSNVAKEKAAIEAQKKEEAAKKAKAKKKAEEKAKKAEEEARKAEEEAKKAEEEAKKAEEEAKEAEVAESEAKNTTKNTKNSKNTNKNTNSSNSSSESSQAQTSSTQGATQPTGSATLAYCEMCGQWVTLPDGRSESHWGVCPGLVQGDTVIAEGDYGCKQYNNGTWVITDEAREAYRAQWEAEKDLYGGVDLDSYVAAHVFH